MAPFLHPCGIDLISVGHTHLWIPSLSCLLSCLPPHSSQNDLHKGNVIYHVLPLHKTLLTSHGPQNQVQIPSCWARPLVTGLDFPLLEHSVLELTSGLWLELISVLFTLVSWLFSRKCPDPGRPGGESFFVPRATRLPLAKHQPPRSCHSAQNLQWFSFFFFPVVFHLTWDNKFKVLINIVCWAWLQFYMLPLVYL